LAVPVVTAGWTGAGPGSLRRSRAPPPHRWAGSRAPGDEPGDLRAAERYQELRES